MMDENLMAGAEALAETLREDRRRLHACAETGFELPETFRYVWERLTEIGLRPKKCGRCGIVAEIGAGERVVLLRADMDALAIREEADVPFACTTGAMHACGHDLHTAMLLGAARLLKDREHLLPGRVRLMFQPAEEILGGAADMLGSGLLDGGKPEAAFMLHVLTNLEVPVGTAIVSAPGVSAPAAAFFEIRVQGKGCHGAMPNTGIDPVTAAAHIVLGLQQIQTRELAMSDECVLTLGMLQAGESANVIPDSAVMQGSMRAFDDQTLAFMLRRAEEIASGTAAVFRAEASFRMLSAAPTLLNDAAQSGTALEALQELLGVERALLSSDLSGDGRKSTGSEDFAEVSHAVPSVMVALAAGQPSAGYSCPAHHPKTMFDESALPAGAAAYAALAMAALTKKTVTNR